MNAYLTYAAMIGAGLYGIDHELELPPEFKGNGYIAKGVAADAAGAVRGDRGAGAIRGRGRDLRPGRRRPLPERRPVEQQTYDSIVHNWERERYLERA